MPLKRVHIIIEGRVQGVFFRDYTRTQARQLGLTGWVRNRPEGTVEAIVEGDASEVDWMINWFNQGSPMSKVTGVQVTEEEPVGENDSFEVHYF